MRQIAATRRCDKSPRLHCCCDKPLSLVLSFEFVRQIAATMIFTCHTRRFVAATCRGDVSQRFVASCASAFIVTNIGKFSPHTYLWDLSNSFSNSFIDFYSCEGFHQVIYKKEWSIKLRIDNGGWHETLNLLHVSICEMLRFVTSYMKQNKSRKQTLESAQCGLEISLNT